MSVSFSIIRNGARCGSSFLICSTSSTRDSVVSVIAFPLAPFCQHRDRRHLARPFPDRLGRHSAVIPAARKIATPRHAGLGAQTCPVHDARMIAQPDLATQDDEIADLAAAGDTNCSNDYAMAAQMRVVPDLYEIVDFGAFPDHRVAQRPPIDCGAGPDFNAVLNDDLADLRNFPVS